jgi:hypothetical protein
VLCVDGRFPLMRFRACVPSPVLVVKCGVDSLRLGWPLGGSVEPSEGKGGESTVAILRFSMW